MSTIAESFPPRTRVRLADTDVARLVERQRPNFFAHDAYVESIRDTVGARLVNTMGEVIGPVRFVDLKATGMADEKSLEALFRRARPELGDRVELVDDSFGPDTMKFFQSGPGAVTGGEIGGSMKVQNDLGQEMQLYWGNLKVVATAAEVRDELMERMRPARGGVVTHGDVVQVGAIRIPIRK